MDVLFNAIGESGNVSAQIAPVMTEEINLVEAIIAAYKASGSYSGELGNILSSKLDTICFTIVVV